MTATELIMTCAKVPSFSSFEEVIHPLIHELCKSIEGVTITPVADNNLIVYVPGRSGAAPIAITSHLDKINHWWEENPYPSELPVSTDGVKIIGQMDDTAGVGVCLAMMYLSQKAENNFPPLYLFLSEAEEGTDFRYRPQILRNGGEGYEHGMGADRIATYLIEQNQLPAACITIDTTPKFKGEPGICLYNQFWHRSKDYSVSEILQNKTTAIQDFFTNLQPNMLLGNAVNDYLNYGLKFNENPANAIPSIAIEPAIYPYHTKNEAVFVDDINCIVDMLEHFLNEFHFDAQTPA
ncbi:MAG: hypothetical protein ACPGXL_06500 [Chitinophagales bacterium]